MCNSKPRSFTEVYLEFLGSSYAATRNPLTVWAAIHWCLNESPKQPLPDWCLDDLAEVASRINVLISPIPKIIPTDLEGERLEAIGLSGKGTGHSPQTPKASQMLHALGFTSKGKNAFKSAAAEDRNYRAAAKYKTFVVTGNWLKRRWKL